MSSVFSIKEAVALYGINNIRIFGAATPFSIVMPHMGIGLKNHNDEQFRTEFFIIEERYQVKDGYKIQIQALDVETFGKENYYQSDFDHKVRDGQFDIYVLTLDGYMPVHVTIKDIIDEHEDNVLNWFENCGFHIQHFFQAK